MNHRTAHDPRPDAEWLAAALRQQAGRHEAQRHRIDAKFNALTAPAPARGHSRARLRSRRLVRVTRLRLIGVPLGVLAVAATATVAVGVSLSITTHTAHPPAQAAPASSPALNAPGPQPIPRGAPSAQRPAGSTSPHSQASPSGLSGPLAAAGSVDPHSNPYWAQEDLHVSTSRAIRALHIVVTVRGGASVQSTGSWTTLLPAAVTSTVQRTAGGLTYDITVNPGQVLSPGTYEFGVQFDRPVASHDPALDAYAVTATTADNPGSPSQASVTGTFAP